MAKKASGKNRTILVCGIPGSGKTTYCTWLAQRKGFDHLNFDELLSGSGAPAHLDLIALLRTKPKDFIHKLSRRRRTVIDWGFRPADISLIRLLQAGGIAVWWFDGDREAALQSFTTRGTVSLVAFRAQMDAIETAWSQIKEVIGDRLIDTVASGPKHLALERIFEEMFGSTE